jgi:hypothetical protein
LWLLSNKEKYHPSANYSRIWYEQVNQTGEIEPGADGSWALHIYAVKDCDRLKPGDEPDDIFDYPWMEISCPTEEGGKCQKVPYSIQSIAIDQTRFWKNGFGPCETSAELGASNGRSMPLVLGVLLSMAVALLV